MIKELKNESKINKYYILIIVLVGFLIRLYGINHGLSDHTIASWGEEDRLLLTFDFWKTGDINPHWFLYPQFYLYIVYLFQAVTFLFGRIFGVYKDLSDFTIQFVINPQNFYFQARLCSAIFGTCTIYAIYLVGKKYFNEITGLISAFFLAFAPLHIEHSHYYYPDIFATFFVILSFIPIYNICISGKLKDYIFAGIAIGFGVGTKYFPLAIVLEVVIAHMFYISNNKFSWNKIVSKNLLLCFLAIAIAFFISSPYSVLSFNEVSAYLASKKDVSGKWFGFEKANDSKIIYHLTVNLPKAMSIPLIILGFSGMIYAFIKNKRESWLLILFLISYFLLIELGGVHFPNYMVTAIPFFLLFASFILTEMINKIKSNRNIILVTLVLLCSSLNIFASIKEVYYISQKHTRITGVEWIEANIPTGAKIVGTTYTPPVLFDQKVQEILNDPAYISKQEIIKEKILSRPIYNLVILPWSPEYYKLDLLKQHFDYIMVDSGIYRRHMASPELYPVQVNFYNDLDEKCMLLIEIEGEPKIPGPTIKIYRIRK